MTTDFPDISFYQGDVNFDIMKTKTDFIILRAGQANYADSKFERNRSECLRVGLPFGIYWFYDDRYSPRAQAEKLASLFAAGHPKPYEIWIDWENTYNGPYSGLSNVVACMELVEQLMGMKTGMYTGYYWFAEHTNSQTHQSQYAWLAQRKLWEAWYTDDINDVLIPKPWTQMTVWQYGTPVVGREYGAQSDELDMNQRVGEEPVEPECIPETGGEMLDVTVVWTDGASVKTGPNTGGSAAHVYAVGEKFKASELVPDNTDLSNPQKLWAKIAEGPYINKYVAVYYPSSSRGYIRCTWVEIDPDPGPEPIPGTEEVVGIHLKDGLVNSLDLNGTVVWNKS